jgi:chorismate synthase
VEEAFALAEKSPVRCPDKKAEEKMMDAIKDAKANGDTLGGSLHRGGHRVSGGSRQSHPMGPEAGRALAQAILSIQAHKGVEMGRGFEMARRKGSELHDEIHYKEGRGFFRESNNAGGIEGGMSNGEPIVIRAAVKPLASLRKPLRSVNILTKNEMTAEIVRSDVCPVASAAVIGEAVTAIALAQAQRKVWVRFGGKCKTTGRATKTTCASINHSPSG